jgi:hypothetical protein
METASMVPYSIIDDVASGSIRVSMHGFWNADTLDMYFADLDRCLHRYRTKGHGVIIISDGRDCSVQSAEIMDKSREIAKGMFMPGDRVALVVSSALNKIQARRSYSGEVFQTFTSIEAAETWAFNPADCSRVVNGHGRGWED